MLPLVTLDTKVPQAPTALVRRPDGRQFYLHSRVDPIEEARFLVADIQSQERTLYVVLGFGLGYHIDALLERTPASAHVAVIESADAQLSAAAVKVRGRRKATWRGDSRLHLLASTDPDLTLAELANLLTLHHLLSIKIVRHVPSMLTAPPYYGRLLQHLSAWLPAEIQRQLTLIDKTLEGDLRNFWANLSSSWNEPPATVLKDQWVGRPAVIVANGPSLTAQLPTLAALRDRALLIAAGSAARTLMTGGIAPDLILSVDPYDLNVAHFVGWDGSDIPLAYYHRVHCGVTRLYAGPMCGFVFRDEPPLPLLEDASPSPFSRGGTVTFSALQMAHVLGANPIVFVGADFAFADGRTHAAGAVYNESFDQAAPPSDFIRVPGVSGGEVLTTRLLEEYRLHMQRYLRHVALHQPTIDHINASESGALIQGTRQHTLDHALARVERQAPPPRDVLRSALASHRRPGRELQSQRLDSWIADLATLTEQLDTASPDQIFEQLAGTTLFTAPGRAYADLRYLFETRYQRGAHKGSALFASRLRHHLRQVLDDLRRQRAVS